MKTTTLIILLFTVYSVKSQNLITNISENASIIVSLNGAKLLNEVAENELEQSLLFKEISSNIFRGKTMTKPTHFADMGVNMNEKMYFALENQNEMAYYLFTYKIKDVTVFEKFIKSGNVSEENFSQVNGLNVLTYSYDSKLYWNNTIAVFIKADYNGRDYRQSYGYDDYDYGFSKETVAYNVVEDAKCESGDSETTIELTEDQIAEIKRQKEEKKRKQEELEAERIRKNKEIRQKKEQFVIDKINFRISDFYSSKHDEVNQKDDKNENKANYKIIKGMNQNLFDSEAVASFYYSNSSSKYGAFPSYYRYGMFSSLFGMQSFFGGNYISNLFFEEDQIKLKSKVLYSNNVKEAINLIYKSKINKQLISFVPQDVLGYWSFSMNTEAFLTEIESVSKNYFEYTEFEFAEEIDLYIDIVSVMLDEEKIGELITGDALIILNDINMETVTYETYDYDENFNSTKVTKTKQELLPKFTVMVGSQNQDIINKSFKIGVKREILTQKNEYYMLDEKYNETSFNLYFAFKDNILFTTNSLQQIDIILKGKADNKLAATHQKRIKKNTSASYLNLNSLIQKLLQDEKLMQDFGYLNDIKDDIISFYGQSKVNDGTIDMETIVNIPTGEKNSAHYLLNFIDKVIANESH